MYARDEGTATGHSRDISDTGTTITSEAMDVDCVGRHPPIKCFNCRKLGHTAMNCREERKIREVGTKEEAEENFPEQSQ